MKKNRPKKINKNFTFAEKKNKVVITGVEHNELMKTLNQGEVCKEIYLIMIL